MMQILAGLRRFASRWVTPQAVRAAGINDDFAWLTPPSYRSGTSDWDTYWDAQLAHGLGPPLFDMFCRDQDLVEVMRQRGALHVLCAGNGISLEPRALAAAGFRVVALDLSSRALQIARDFPTTPDLLRQYLDLSQCRLGGSVDFVLGSVLASDTCPGPFDVIIERRTAQLFPSEERSVFLQALATRLAPDGLLVSHCHDACWKPGTDRQHTSEDWLRAADWQIWNQTPGDASQGRTAWLFVTTG
jgi:SAM-dependent methyltransferase